MPLLYHGTADSDLSVLVPRTRKEDYDKSSLVFASTDEVAAYLYAIQDSNNREMPKIISSGDNLTPILITPYQSQYFGDALNGRVFTIADDKFVPSGKSSDEWISREEIPLNKDIAIKVTNANQALEKGVQLFLVKGGLEAWSDVFEKIKPLTGRDEWLAFLKEQVDAGNMTHENRERNLRPMDLNTGRLEAGTKTVAKINQENIASNAVDAAIIEHPEHIPVKRDVAKAALTGAGIGAVLFPALGVLFDAVSKHKSFTSGRRLKFLASEASLGAVINGGLNATVAWGQNKIADRKHAERIAAEKQEVKAENSSGNSLS